MRTPTPAPPIGGLTDFSLAKSQRKNPPSLSQAKFMTAPLRPFVNQVIARPRLPGNEYRFNSLPLATSQIEASYGAESISLSDASRVLSGEKARNSMLPPGRSRVVPSLAMAPCGNISVAVSGGLSRFASCGGLAGFSGLGRVRPSPAARTATRIEQTAATRMVIGMADFLKSAATVAETAAPGRISFTTSALTLFGTATAASDARSRVDSANPRCRNRAASLARPRSSRPLIDPADTPSRRRLHPGSVHRGNRGSAVRAAAPGVGLIPRPGSRTVRDCSVPPAAMCRAEMTTRRSNPPRRRACRRACTARR